MLTYVKDNLATNYGTIYGQQQAQYNYGYQQQYQQPVQYNYGYQQQYQQPMQNVNDMGLNLNSPTVQMMMQNNGGFNQQPLYQQQFGNIGMQGYNSGSVNPYLDYMNNPYAYNPNQMMNGGYYSGMYNYYNPQEIRRQMEEQRRLEEERLNNYIEIQIMKQKIYNDYYGLETDKEYLREYYNPNTYAEINKDMAEFEEMRRLSAISNDPSHRLENLNNRAINEFFRIQDEIRSKHPIDQDFVEYMNTAGDICREAIINENIREMKKNVANMYDRNAYNQLTSMHRNNFMSLRQNVSADDLSISLPDHLKRSDEYQRKKNEFLNFITANDARNRGGIRNG